MGVVKAHEAAARGIVQRERIAQAVRAFPGSGHPLDFEFEPVPLLEVVDTAVERQQELQGVFVGDGGLVCNCPIMIAYLTAVSRRVPFRGHDA